MKTNPTPTPWYRTSRWSYAIEVVLVDRETKHCIWVSECEHRRASRITKVGDRDIHYRTKEEAVAALRLRAAEKLILLEEEISELRHALTKL